MLFKSVLTAVTLAGAANAALRTMDPALITAEIQRASSRHQASLDAYERNKLQHPELFNNQKMFFAKAGHIEKRANERRKRELVERQSSGNGSIGQVPLQDFFSGPIDIMIYAPEVQIGTPAQTFPLLIDTGSADLWVYAEGTGSPQPEWNANVSSTAVVSDVPWEIQYGRGAQEGFLNEDVVSIGGYSDPTTIFAAANTLNEAFQPYPISGLLGLGFGVISASGAITWFERLLNATLLPEPYFAIYFIRASDITDEVEGSIGGAQLCVGCYDPSTFTGEISWNTVISPAFWTIAMDGIVVNGQVVSGTAMNAALDSGTTLIQIPVTAADAFYNRIGGVPSGQGDGSYVIPCTLDVDSIAFQFNGVVYEIPPYDLLTRVSQDQTQCVLGIAGVDNMDAYGNPVAIVGGIFLKNAVSIYSYSYNGAPAIGLARSNIAGSWNVTQGSATSAFSQPEATGTVSIGGAPPPRVSSVQSGASRSETVSLTGTAASTPMRTASGAQASQTAPASAPTSAAQQINSSALLVTFLLGALAIVLSSSA